MMLNEVIRDKSRCANFTSDKSRFLKRRPNKIIFETFEIILILKCLYASHYKTCLHIV